jgi:hypothetical protein
MSGIINGRLETNGRVIFGPDSENIVTNGLVLYLDAAKTTSYPGSGIIWYDISGNGNNGTLINGPTFNSANGGFIVFDGVNDFVNMSSIINPSNNFTADIWFNSSSVSTFQCMLYIRGSSSTDYLVVTLYNSKILASKNENADSSKKSSTNLSSNIWYNVVVTKTSSNITSIYVNGVDETTSAVGGEFLGANVQGFQIANDYIFGGILIPYIGGISNTKLYNRVLTSAEVLQNYDAIKGRFGI